MTFLNLCLCELYMSRWQEVELQLQMPKWCIHCRPWEPLTEFISNKPSPGQAPPGPEPDCCYPSPRTPPRPEEWSRAWLQRLETKRDKENRTRRHWLLTETNQDLFVCSYWKFNQFPLSLFSKILIWKGSANKLSLTQLQTNFIRPENNYDIFFVVFKG